jgi:hypothetical protein
VEKYQKGFSVVEGLLIVVIAGMLGGVGWYVWHSQKQVDKTYSQTANGSAVPSKKIAETTTAPASSSVGYFVIKEWDVRAKYSGNLSLEYAQYKTDANEISLSSSQLDSAGGLCKVNLSTDPGFGGIIDRYKSTDKYIIKELAQDSGKTAAQYAATLKQGDYGHVGDYYYFYIAPQAACSESQSGQDVQTKTHEADLSIVSRLEAAPAH